MEQPPGRRARRPVLLVAGLLIVLTVAGLVLASGQPAGWLRDAREAGRTTVAGRAPVDAVAAKDRATGLTQMLQTRADGVVDDDADAWMGTVDHADPAFRSAQQKIFDRIAVLPVSEWGYQLLASTPASAQRSAATGGDAWVARVRLDYRLGEGTGEIRRMQYLTVVDRPEGWRVVTDTDGGTERDLWDLTDVAVDRGSRSLVISARSQRSRSAAYVRAADAGARTVDEALGTGWPRTVVLLAPASAGQMAQLLGWEDPARLEQIAAVTTGGGSGDGGSSDRIVLNPDAFASFGLLGRRVVITHETVHVAARAMQEDTPPLWLEEGYADWVAYRDSGLAASSVAEDALQEVSAGHLPARLPAEDDFDAGKGGDIGVAYGEAWLALELIERQEGKTAVTRFYETAAGIGAAMAPASPEAALEAAFTGLHTDRAAFTERWRIYLKELAG